MDAKTGITLLRVEVITPRELMCKEVEERISRDSNIGELISRDKNCQRMLKSQLFRYIPIGPRNIRVNFVPRRESRRFAHDDDKVDDDAVAIHFGAGI